MTWLLVVGAVWMAFAVPVALLIGRSIRLGDRIEPREGPVGVPDRVPNEWTTPQTESPRAKSPRAQHGG